MPIQLYCRYCLTGSSVSRRMAGRGIRCPSCGKTNTVPAIVPAPSSNTDDTPTGISRAPAAPSLMARVKIRCPRCRTRIKVVVEPPRSVGPTVSGTVPAAGSPVRIKIQCPSCAAVLVAATHHQPVLWEASSDRSEEAADEPADLATESEDEVDLPTLPEGDDDPKGICEAAWNDPNAETRVDPVEKESPPEIVGESTSEAGPSERPRQRKGMAAGPVQLLDEPEEWGKWPGGASLVLGGLALVMGSGLGMRGFGAFAGVVSLVLGGFGLVHGLRTGGRLGFPLAGMIIALLALLCPALLGIRGGPRDDRLQRITQAGTSVPVDPAEWVDARKNALQQASARVALCNATIWWGSPEAFRDRKPRGLSLMLRIDHVGPRGSLRYTSWARSGPRTGQPMARLVDDRGREFRLLDPEVARGVPGHVATATLKQRGYVSDVLVFEAPTDKVQSMRLELSCEAIGLEGHLRLAIPGDMIDYQSSQ